jgi:general secretion pathway protein G
MKAHTKYLAVLLTAIAISYLILPHVTPVDRVDEVTVTKFLLEDLAEALDRYRHDVGNFPSQETGLVGLLENTENALGWRGPYLRKKHVPKDPWGNEFEYLARDAEFMLVSRGADGNHRGIGEDGDISVTRRPPEKSEWSDPDSR